MKFRINESRRDDLLLKYMELLNNNGINVNIGQVKSKLLNKFVVEGNIHNLSLRSNFYLAGVARYYFEGSLTKNSDLSLLKPETWQGQDVFDTWDTAVCKKLDALINVLRNAYIDTIGTQMLEPEDLGELPIKDLFKKYSNEIRKELGGGKKKKATTVEIDTNENVGNDYTFDIMYSFNDCKKYNVPTSPGAWCITYGQNHYNGYVSWLNIHYVIFRKNGWENIQRPEDPKKDPNWTSEKPHDEYGNSLIAVLQSNDSPEPVYITSRWNHGAGGVHCEADHAYTKEEFEQITGVTDADLKRIYDIWKFFKGKRKTNTVNKKEENFVVRSLKYLQMRINAGENPEKLFDTVNSVYGSPKINKGTFVCSAKISETTMGTNERAVYFVFDNGKIVFETVCTSFSAMDLVSNTAVIVNLSQDKHIIYSLKKHKVLSINGNYIFRRIPELVSTDENGDYYFEVKESMFDVALFSTETMEPIKLPNGFYWFNKLEKNIGYNYGSASRIECEIYIKKPPLCFQIIYDMSSGESFFYNTTTDSFFEIPVPNEIQINRGYYNDYEATVEPGDGYLPYLDRTESANQGNSVIIPVRYGKPHESYRGGFYYTDESALQLLRNNKPISINGCVWFSSMDVYGSNFRRIKTIDDKAYLTDIDVTKYIVVPENFNFDIIEPEGEENDIFRLYRRRREDAGCVLYDTNSDAFLVFPSNSGVIFNKGENSYSWTWNSSKKVRGSCWEFKSTSDVPKKWIEYGDVYEDGSFKISYDSLRMLCNKIPAKWLIINPQEEIQDTVRLDRNDVHSMVTESVKRILKRIISA